MIEIAVAILNVTKIFPVPFQRRSIVAVRDLTLQVSAERLRQRYDAGENERLPTLITRLKFLEDKLDIPLDQRIPDAGR